MFNDIEITKVYSIQKKEEISKIVIQDISDFIEQDNVTLHTSILNIDGLRESIEFKFNTIIMNSEWDKFLTIQDVVSHLEKEVFIETISQ